MIPKYKLLQRPCRYCGVYFTPSSRRVVICDDCNTNAREQGIKKRKQAYQNIKLLK